MERVSVQFRQVVEPFLELSELDDELTVSPLKPFDIGSEPLYVTDGKKVNRSYWVVDPDKKVLHRGTFFASSFTQQFHISHFRYESFNVLSEKEFQRIEYSISSFPSKNDVKKAGEYSECMLVDYEVRHPAVNFCKSPVVPSVL